MNTSPSHPKVSVCIVTYNQENHIKQCLQSVVDQERDFEIEVIISDDCSTDNTPNIIRDFAEKYDFIIPILREKNIGAFKNFEETHNMAKGEYVCHLDGDDYWLPSKIIRQKIYLDSNLDCNICYTRGIIKDSITGRMREDKFIFEKKSKFNRSDIIRTISIGLHSSKMYRRSCRNYPYPAIDLIDFFEDVEQVNNGTANYLDNQPYTVYLSDQGISGSPKVINSIIHSLDFFLEKYPEEKLNINIASLSLLISALKKMKNIPLTLKLYVKSFHIKTPIIFLKHHIEMKRLSSPFK